MSILWGRRVILRLDEESFECGSAPGRPDGLRCAFRVSRTVKKSVNTASIELYNISREQRLYSLLRKRELRVGLAVGYGDNFRYIFEGNPEKNGVTVAYPGPDRILRIKANDCLRKYQTGTVSVRVNGNTTMGAVVPEVLRQLGLPAGALDYDPSQPLQRGFRGDGPVRDVLDRLAAIAGADWSFQNGRFQFVRRGNVTKYGPVFATANGTLIGDPETTDKGVRFKALMDPDLEPGGGFSLEPAVPGNGGFYKCIQVDYIGDTWGGEFVVQGLGRRMKT